ncbi:MAG: hypothetical protein ACRDKW_16060 [Actinomycetota bacterium]
MRARLVASFFFVASLVTSLLAPPAVPSAAATAAAGDALTVTAGWGGLGFPGQSIPIRARIAAERLLAGRLEVELAQRGASTAATFTLPVEVPGGSVKEYVLAVPTPEWYPLDALVVLRSRSGDVVARELVTVRATQDEELVGLLPGSLGGASLPGSAPLAVDAGVARFFLLDEALLAQAPHSLEALGTVGMPASGLGDLAPAARDGLLSWVDAGGRLLVDSAPGVPVEGLPAPWQPGATGRAAAGRGTVLATGGAMAAGRWAALVEPTVRGEAAPGSISATQRVSQSLAVDAGVSSRGAGWLTAFLLVYVALAGPVTYLVLRRKRREELAWVVIPVVAVLFATGSYAEGRDLRAAGTAHETVIVSGSGVAGGPTAFSFVGLIAQRTGTVSVGFPEDWRVRISSEGFDGTRSGVVEVGLGRATQEARMPLNSGQMGVAFAAGPVGAGDGLSVTATVREGRLAGTVRNGTPFKVERAAVVVGTRAVEVGTLGAGEEKAWTMSGEAPFPNSDPLAGALWPGRPVGFEDGTAVSYALWQVVQAALGPDHPAPGSALAVGFTRDHTPEFVIDGNPERPAGRTMLVATGRVGFESGAVPSLAVARSLVRGAGLGTPGFIDMSAGGAGVARFELPAGSKPVATVIRAMNGAQVDVWRDGAWRPIDYGTVREVDSTGLQGDLFFEGQMPGAMPAPVPAPAIPPGMRIDPDFPTKPGFPIAAGGTVVDYDVAVPADGILWVRTQTADAIAGSVGFTWVREAS